MKKTVLFVLFAFIAPAHSVEQSVVSSSVENDYVWQERFKSVMSKAESGVAKAQYSIGEMFEKGRGTQKNIKQAFGWYAKAADQRYTRAQFKVGYLYYKGLGVRKSSSKAYKHLKKPADKGNVRAQYYLGKLYANGQGVSKNQEKALIWYSRASTGGFGPAEDALEKIKKVLAKQEQMEDSRPEAVTTKVESKKIKPTKLAAKSIKATPENIAKTGLNKKVRKVKLKKVKTTKLAVVTKNILSGGWIKGRKPAEFLPSTITHCKKTSRSIMECLSETLKRNIGVANITYITKAVLFEIEDSGEFKIAYRNKILKIDKIQQIVDEDDEEGESKPRKITVKKGWQETEHQLECKIEQKRSIGCVKNKVRKLKFKSELKT